MYKLIIEDDEGKTTVVPISRDEITLGRKEGNNIRLTERNISRQHARLFTANAMVYVEDLDSYNGIRVNGDRIEVKTPVGVREGDLIEIGDYHLAIQMEGSDSPGLAGNGAGEETTQRVSLGAMAGGGGEEVTAQVAMTPVAHHEPTDLSATMPNLGDPSATVPNLDSMPSPYAGAPLRMDITQDGAPDPSMMAGGGEPAIDVAPRPEPTAIIRTTQIPQASPETQYPRIVVVSTALAGRTFNLTADETVIGRTEDNDVQIDHRSVSRNHAKIVREGNRYTVVDLKSANGVLVNGEEYAKIDLRRGDIVELGHVKLRFVEAGERFELSAAEIERLARDEGDADGFAQNDPTSMVTGRVGVRATPGGGKKLPVKVIGIVAGVLVLGITAGALVLGGGKEPAPAPTAPADPPETAAAATPDPEPAEKERKKPPRQAAVEKKAPPSDPEPDPKEAEAARAIKAGNAALKSGDFDEAKESFAKALSLGDVDGQAREGKEAAERELSAREALDAALGMRDSDPLGAYRALNAVPTGTRARDRAISEAKALKPKLVQRLLKDGEKALADDPAEAKNLAEQALDLESGSREAQKLIDKAEKALKAKRERDQKAARNNPPAGGSKTSSDNGKATAEQARKVLEDGNRAILLGQFDEAVSKGKQSLKLDPSLTEAHKLLGVAFARQGKYCDAKFHYKKFIELNPTSPMVDRIKQILKDQQELQNCP